MSTDQNTIPTPLDILVRGRALISEPRNWIQMNFAKDDNKLVCKVEDPRACSFCSLGALARVATVASLAFPPGSRAREQIFENHERAFYVLSNFVLTGSVGHWNDTHTHDQVLSVWDQAIKTEAETEAETEGVKL
jgi:hypothetical protein